MELARRNKVRHFGKRLEERFNIRLKPNEREKISDQLYTARALKINKDGTRSVKKKVIKGKTVFVIYDEVYTVPCSVVPSGANWRKYIKRIKKYGF